MQPISAPFQPSSLRLKNGRIFHGFSPAWQQKNFFGEVVFTTGMTGYPESLTDPSYAGQILVFTYPLIGNYGVPPSEKWESSKIYASGVVVNEACEQWSHHSGLQSLTEWLRLQNVPLISGVDTRALTKELRSLGTMMGLITKKANYSHPFPDTSQEDWVRHVSPNEKKIYKNGKKVVVAIDCGMKENIIRSLTSLTVTIHRVPHDYDFTNDVYDGVFISNGPGNPALCLPTIAHLKKAFKQDKPIFGICLGTQLMALAAGGNTYKLHFGHRGQNQPCIDTESSRCYITSQNHGYAVEEKSLPKEWRVTFRNLNDGSVEGIAHKSKPFFSVQFHPEASPGPTDTLWLFDKFKQLL